jgi:tripartite-type tricarboxylate transporter receptor subunit TctC
MKRIILLVFLLVFIMLSLSTVLCAEGQKEGTDSYPSKSVEVIVPWAAGGNTDITTRALLSSIGNYFPGQMVVINKPGAGGTIGTTYVANQKPDGYTLLITAWAPFITQPHMTSVQYSLDDFYPVMQVAFSPRFVCAHSDTPYDTLSELVEYAKANPDDVKVGVAAVGSTGHLAMEQLELEADIKLNTIPQDGGAGSLVALLGHHVDVVPLDVALAIDSIKSGSIKPLGVTDTERHPDFPDIPTIEEQGYGIVTGVATHVYVPAGTPADRIKIIHDAFKNVLEDESFLKLAEKLQIGYSYKNHDDTLEQLTTVSKNFGEIIQILGLGSK